MNKTELIEKAAGQAGLSRAQTALAVNAALDIITAALAENQRVQLLGFGTFEAKQCAARRGRHPATGAAIDIPAHRTVRFFPGQKLCDALEDDICD